MNILVTGGTGFIGSHTTVELLTMGHNVIVIDNLSNSSELVLHRIKEITGIEVKFYKIDLCDYEKIEEVFIKEYIEIVIHFAGLKAVGESCKIPLMYYQNNLISTLNLLDIMDKHNIKKIIFSSSATVYGNPKEVPIKEEAPLSTLNPYGRTKLVIEDILRDLYASDSSWQIVILRYFNPIGAHKSSLIGEAPNGTPNNLLPYISIVAAGAIEQLCIYGNDYDTCDGTGVRDYIHIIDLARGHIKAVKKIQEGLKGINVFNLGTGKGYSVLEVINAFEKVSGKYIKYSFTHRREGDIAICYADCSKANKELDWKAEYDIYDMCEDAWRWQCKKT